MSDRKEIDPRDIRAGDTVERVRVSPDSADLTPSANPTEMGRHGGDERNET